MKKTGVIGVGWFGQAHSRVYNEISNLKAVCDSDEQTRKKVAEKYNINSYSNHLEMIENEELDAVSIVLPPEYIPSVAEDIVKKGIDVLLEKPMGIDLNSVKNLLKYNKQVRMTCGFIEMFNPVIIRLQNQIKEIGEILTISSRRIGRFPRRHWNHGVVLDLAIHEIYIHKIFLGKVEKIESMLGYFHEGELKEFEDAALILLRFKNDAYSLIEVNWLTPIKYRKITVYGREAVFEVDYSTQELKLVKSNTTSSGNELRVETNYQPYSFEEPLKQELRAFLYDKKNPVPLDFGIECLEIAIKSLKKSD
ncbi:MAG: Gfo/Idh/MocA family protein [Candidatus Helarchaeota archaeon]